MDKDTALQKAIEAIEFEGVRDSEEYWLMMDKVRTACKEALEPQTVKFSSSGHYFRSKEPKYLYAYSYDGLIVWSESNQNIADRFVFIGKIEVQDD